MGHINANQIAGKPGPWVPGGQQGFAAPFIAAGILGLCYVVGKGAEPILYAEPSKKEIEAMGSQIDQVLATRFPQNINPNDERNLKIAGRGVAMALTQSCHNTDKKIDTVKLQAAVYAMRDRVQGSQKDTAANKMLAYALDHLQFSGWINSAYKLNS